MPALASTEVEQIIHNQGASANERQRQRIRKLTDARFRGDLKPATLLNLSPFELSLGSGGLIQYVIPACPPDKQFYAHTVPADHTLSFSKFLGNQEMSDKSIRSRSEVNLVTPIQQLMEFKNAYFADGGLQGLRQGGIVVFEGTAQSLKKDLLVRVPQYVYENGERYLSFAEQALGELIEEAEEQLKARALSVIQQCNTWLDQGGQKALNIQSREHAWADFCVRKKWIAESPKWRHAHVRTEDQCPRCSDQYKSKTGVCKCSYVVHPFVAFMAGEIKSDHVRMDTLSKDEWAKVRAEEERRTKAKG